MGALKNLNIEHELLRAGRPQWALVFTVGTGKNTVEKSDGTGISRTESFQNARAHLAVQISLHIYVGTPS